MALLRYLQPRDGLPDLRGTLCLCLPSQAIAEASWEVQEATSSTKRKRGSYKRYSASVRAISCLAALGRECWFERSFAVNGRRWHSHGQLPQHMGPSRYISPSHTWVLHRRRLPTLLVNVVLSHAPLQLVLVHGHFHTCWKILWSSQDHKNFLTREFNTREFSTQKFPDIRYTGTCVHILYVYRIFIWEGIINA